MKGFGQKVKSVLIRIPWGCMIAWCFFCFITLFSFVCVICATGIVAEIKRIGQEMLISAPPIVVCIAKILLPIPCETYRLLSDAAEWAWNVLQPLVVFLDPVFKADTRSECFKILGLAGSVIPAVYNAGTKRTKGILISDMMKHFFPLYGIVMLQNFLLSIMGQFAESVLNWKFLLPATLLTTIYSVVLILASGLYQRVSQYYVGKYIAECSRVLRPGVDGSQSSSYKNKRAAFLSDLIIHISKQLAAANTPYCNTDVRLRKEIQQVVSFILPHSQQRELIKESPSSIIEEYAVLFSTSKLTGNAICDSVYYELPASESVRNAFALQIEHSSEFWKLVLGPIPSPSEKGRAACRIFDSMGFFPKERCGSLTVMTCGLIVYLYKTGCSREDGQNACNVDCCVDFAEQMWSVFREDLPFLNEGATMPTPIVSLYAEMLFIIFAISQIEQYLKGDSVAEDSTKRALDEFWKSSHVHIGRELLMDEPFRKYLALALCVIRQLPSPANKPWFPAQKKRMRSYALAQKSKIGA